MAEDVIIKDGDMIQITINPPAIVAPIIPPVPLVASGFSKIDEKLVCVEGDEYPPLLKSPLPYMSGAFATPGTGKLTITLKDANKTSVTKDNDKKMLLKGQSFDVKFDVQNPAINPTGGVPDPTPSYTGTAVFISTNTLAKAE